jgi:hypothetical protein
VGQGPLRELGFGDEDVGDALDGAALDFDQAAAHVGRAVAGFDGDCGGRAGDAGAVVGAGQLDEDDGGRFDERVAGVDAGFLGEGVDAEDAVLWGFEAVHAAAGGDVGAGDWVAVFLDRGAGAIGAPAVF